MKKILLVTSLFSIGLMACKKEEINNKSPKDYIVGTWDFDKAELQEFENDELISENTLYPQDGSILDLKGSGYYYYHFKLEEDWINLTGRYKVEGTRFVFIDMNSQENNVEMKIKKIDEHNLVLELHEIENEEEDINTFYFSK